MKRMDIVNNSHNKLSKEELIINRALASACYDVRCEYVHIRLKIADNKELFRMLKDLKIETDVLNIGYKFKKGKLVLQVIRINSAYSLKLYAVPIICRVCEALENSVKFKETENEIRLNADIDRKIFNKANNVNIEKEVLLEGYRPNSGDILLIKDSKMDKLMLGKYIRHDRRGYLIVPGEDNVLKIYKLTNIKSESRVNSKLIYRVQFENLEDTDYYEKLDDVVMKLDSITVNSLSEFIKPDTISGTIKERAIVVGDGIGVNLYKCEYDKLIDELNKLLNMEGEEIVFTYDPKARHRDTYKIYLKGDKDSKLIENEDIVMYLKKAIRELKVYKKASKYINERNEILEDFLEIDKYINKNTIAGKEIFRSDSFELGNEKYSYGSLDVGDILYQSYSKDTPKMLGIVIHQNSIFIDVLPINTKTKSNDIVFTVDRRNNENLYKLNEEDIVNKGALNKSKQLFKDIMTKFELEVGRIDYDCIISEYIRNNDVFENKLD